MDTAVMSSAMVPNGTNAAVQYRGPVPEAGCADKEGRQRGSGTNAPKK